MRDASTGALAYGGSLRDGVGGVDGLDGGFSLCLSPDDNHLYVTGLGDHAVSWYERNANSGALTYLGNFKGTEFKVSSADYLRTHCLED